MQIVKTDGLKFVCYSDNDRFRAQTLLTKEPGTIRWLRTIPAGSVFYDVGASTGIYSIFAGRLIGPTGCVYAFEPHLMSAVAIAANISSNDLLNVHLHVAALSNTPRIVDFNYKALQSGTTDSQLGISAGQGGTFTPKFVEQKYALTLDLLLQAGLRAPDYIKIDVDGQELKVLDGARNALRSAKEVQIETSPHTRARIIKFMTSKRFRIKEVHYTAGGEEGIANGLQELVYDNHIFEREPTS